MRTVLKYICIHSISLVNKTQFLMYSQKKKKMRIIFLTEPGYYKENEFGMRLENLVQVKEVPVTKVSILKFTVCIFL